ncbi:MAG: hypothetical protein LH615_00015 [Ferruginibacter sp.]|nr:hypothetical protein [Ferruginibacter sp.]
MSLIAYPNKDQEDDMEYLLALMTDDIPIKPFFPLFEPEFNKACDILLDD